MLIMLFMTLLSQDVIIFEGDRTLFTVFFCLIDLFISMAIYSRIKYGKLTRGEWYEFKPSRQERHYPRGFNE